MGKMRVRFSVEDPQGAREVPAAPGETLAGALFRAGCYVGAPLCAGLGRCGRCRVRYLADPPEPLPAETRRLGEKAVAGGWRLSCLRPALGGERLEVGDPGPSPAYDRVGEIAGRAGDGVLGLAVDLGTTGLAWRILDRATGVVAAEGRGVNPQLGAGGDVVSRLAFALSPGGADYLRGLVLDVLARKAALAGDRLDGLCLAGNPAMVSILCGKSLAGLARAPYALAWAGGETVALGRGLPPAYVPPLLGPFVGADISAGLTALLRRAPAFPFLLADLGTNAEMVLALAPDRFLAASAPLGPALEGVGLSHGALAGPGVVVSFDLAPTGLVPVFFEGREAAGPARGIAGPGYLRLAATLREQGVLDADGRFAQNAAPTPLGERLRRQLGREGGEAYFPVAGGRLYASDVEELLKVKAACNLAVAALLRAAGCGTAALDAVYLAGAFGAKVSAEALETLGFFPPGLAARLRIAGNLSLEGASLFLTDPGSRDAAEALPGRTTIVPLVPDAGESFISRMVFAYVP
ncbi:ASKHA domain-containing protein [Solidesulfovibrio sp.]|uniref:ASKHA domain-containing protein n=1 Tax=Solidesulfovibrio sp. TaxID=2910990 RepID=UPI00261D54A6|nr:ASKHA domain-containing protein [Solidesulfovibrio sp.]